MRTTALRGAGITAVVAIVALPMAASAADNGVTRRVNISNPGGNTANGDSTRDQISEDGNYVTFQSRASNLVPNDHNGKYDVFYVDRRNPAGTLTLVSRAAGTAGSANGQSNFSDVNGDGTVVVFDSEATNLLPAGNHAGGVFVRYLKNDSAARSGRKAGTVVQVDLSTTGDQPDGTSGRPTISEDGRYVAFNSNADNLAPGFRHRGDIYVRDLWRNTTRRATFSSSGGPVNGVAFRAQMSSNGAKIAYQAQASNIDASAVDNNHAYDIYVSPNPFLVTGPPKGKLASTLPNGSAGGGQRPGISGNAQYVAFQSTSVLASPAIAGRTNVFRRDLSSSNMIVVSVRYNGTAATVNSTRGSLNYDGSIVGFVSGDREIVRNDTNGQRDVFIRKMPGGPSVAVSVDADTGRPARTCGGSAAAAAPAATPGFRPGADDISTRPALSRSGLQVAFVSSLCNLQHGVTNNGSRNDVYVRAYPSSPF